MAKSIKKSAFNAKSGEVTKQHLLTRLVDEALALTQRCGKRILAQQKKGSDSKKSPAYLFAEYEAEQQIILGLILQLCEKIKK